MRIFSLEILLNSNFCPIISNSQLEPITIHVSCYVSGIVIVTFNWHFLIKDLLCTSLALDLHVFFF